jgi:hypothetical protein
MNVVASYCIVLYRIVLQMASMRLRRRVAVLTAPLLPASASLSTPPGIPWIPEMHSVLSADGTVFEFVMCHIVPCRAVLYCTVLMSPSSDKLLCTNSYCRLVVCSSFVALLLYLLMLDYCLLSFSFPCPVR